MIESKVGKTRLGLKGEGSCNDASCGIVNMMDELMIDTISRPSIDVNLSCPAAENLVRIVYRLAGRCIITQHFSRVRLRDGFCRTQWRRIHEESVGHRSTVKIDVFAQNE